MEGLVMTLIPLVFLLTLIVAVGMFVDVAFFDGGRIAAERERLARLWEPPYVKGRELLVWARERGAAMAGALLSRASDDGSTRRTVDELHTGATLAMLPHVSRRDARKVIACPEGGQGAIGVTTPEVLDLVAWIRANLPRRQQQAILERARSFSDGDRPVPSAPPAGCALQGDDCVCVAYAARPLRCRPFHAASILSSTLGLSSEAETTDRARARVVADGVEEGWGRALSASGRDGRVYELNSALALALDAPDLTRRWAEGEAVLAGCTPAPQSRTLHL